MNEQAYGSAPILKLFFKCTLPAMVGMGFSAVYSVIDGIFVGHYIGQEALAFPGHLPVGHFRFPPGVFGHPCPALATRRCLGAQFRFQRFQCGCGGGDCQEGFENDSELSGKKLITNSGGGQFVPLFNSDYLLPANDAE